MFEIRRPRSKGWNNFGRRWTRGMGGHGRHMCTIPKVNCLNTACSQHNNRNMTGNSVEKCFVVLNVKSEVKLRLKTFY